LESNSSRTDVTLTVLQARLLILLKNRINNGEFTERGLARMVGISQPQVHNVLKGARKLSLQTADRFLCKLQLSVLDLISQSEFTSEIALRSSLDSLLSGGLPSLALLQLDPLLTSRRGSSLLDLLTDISPKGRIG
jgi:predicted XRE-type DNA-binding protein